MGCIKLEDYEYTGIKKGMAKESKKEANSVSADQLDNLLTKLDSIEKAVNSDSEKKINKIGLVSTVVAIVLAVMNIFSYVIKPIQDYTDLTRDIEELQDKVDKLVADSTEMHDYIYEDGGVKDQLGIINEALNIKILNVTDEETSSAIEEASVEKKETNYVASAFTEESPIGVDAEGHVYIAKELIDETIILTYIENDKEVYFLGQYNENYHWDGYCVTNSYNLDGTLYGICESNFDDGKRLDYTSFYYNDNNEWIYAKRELSDGENVGITINYYIADNSAIKNFTESNVRITDILYADEYISKQNTIRTKIYTGNTVNNKFDDDSGDAYEIKYDKNGFVELLYVGNFSRGFCEDSTGQAFSIAYSDEYDAYFYNTGKFLNGNAVEHSTNPVTVEEIKQIVKEYSFDCELKWKQ